MQTSEPERLFYLAGIRECHLIAEEVVTEIQTNPTTPEDSGDMKMGYKAKFTPEGAEIVTDVEYWKWVEYGHFAYNQFGGPYSYVEERPHVRPAIEVVRGRNA